MNRDVKLSVNDLKISFRTDAGKVQAVRNISFDLHTGETLAIVGESGSGKSVTSKAIMGILAGNSIVEGGEILYDGQDLLKISEEDYHKIRGDKIAMIFQDPMSSLNPIMKVGRQLTEAMILKAKTGKKNAREEFNTKLKLLGEVINAADEKLGVDNKAVIAEKLKVFDSFCIASTKVEEAFNEAYGNATQLEVEIDNVIRFLELKRKIELDDELKSITKSFNETFNPYVVVHNQANDDCLAKLVAFVKQGKKVNGDEVLPVLRDALAIVKEALAKDKPNFFTLGYYLYCNPNADVTTLAVKELNQMTREYLDTNFMIDFIKTAEKGVLHSHKLSIEAKIALLPELRTAIEYFKAGNIDQKTAEKYVKELNSKVEQAIDRLSVKKNSTEYVFHSAFETAVKEYFDGVKNNPVEEKIYLKNKKKYDSIVAKGQEPDWVLKPQVIVDLDFKLANIC